MIFIYIHGKIWNYFLIFGNLMSLLPILGLMSGTSMDGIDSSILYTDGITFERTKFNSITPYSNKTKSLLKKALVNPIKFIKNKTKMNELSLAVTFDHVKASQKLLTNFDREIKLVGFHGQTIFHNPEKNYSIQLGDANLLSKLLKSSVMHQFRKADLDAGGQGAPIAPIYHKAIIEKLSLDLPAIIINLGGVSNLTFWNGKELIGFDTGPANNLMDSFMQNNFNLPYDFDGKVSESGNPDLKLVEGYCNANYFKKPFPKSLDRSTLFKNDNYHKIINLDEKDVMATLCYITLRSIKKAYNLLPQIPKVTIITGGGQKNKFLVRLIKDQIFGEVLTAQEINLPGDYIEAELIAFLAARNYFGLPSTFPSTTGALKEVICGEYVRYK